MKDSSNIDDMKKQLKEYMSEEDITKIEESITSLINMVSKMIEPIFKFTNNDIDLIFTTFYRDLDNIKKTESQIEIKI